MDFEFLKKLNKMHQDIENIFDMAVKETKLRYNLDCMNSEEETEALPNEVKIFSLIFLIFLIL